MSNKGLRHHGLSGTPENKAWSNMKQRCNNPNRDDYRHYGGRGIKVCERWSGAGGFLNFLEDMGKRPSPNHSIDRIDVNSDYSPENCRWATRRQQTFNVRPRGKNTSGIIGVHMSNGHWVAMAGRNYVGRFDTVEEAAEARRQALNEAGFFTKDEVDRLVKLARLNGAIEELEKFDKNSDEFYSGDDWFTDEEIRKNTSKGVSIAYFEQRLATLKEQREKL